MIKTKITKIFLLTLFSIFFYVANITTTMAACPASCPAGKVCFKNACTDYTDLLLQIPADSKNEDIKKLRDLPQVTVESALSTAIKTILGAAMLLTIIAIVVAGIYYLQSQGQEEDITKAKNIILYLIIGMAIMAGAYGFVSGVIQFKFF